MAIKLEAATRDEWFEHRRNYLTASEVAKAVRSPKYAADLREEKATGERKFHGNEYTQFGSVHEEEIALAVILSEDTDLFMNGDTLWASEEYKGFAATPDLVNADLSWVGEVKTVGKHHDWGDRPIPANYFDQVQWQMLVTGARQCLFIWQPYERDGEGVLQLVDEPRTRVIPRDEERISELIEFGTRWLAGEDQPTETPDIGDLLAERLDVDRQIAALEARKKLITADISAAVGDTPGSWEYPGLGRVTVTKPRVSTRFDKKRFAADHPELVGQYETQVTGAPSLRIVAEKED